LGIRDTFVLLVYCRAVFLFISHALRNTHAQGRRVMLERGAGMREDVKEDRRRTVLNNWIEEFAIFLELDLDPSWVLEIGRVSPIWLEVSI
jgi:hypothetical protein